MAAPQTDVVASASVAPNTQLIRCANCLQPMEGHFCSQCGAPRADERPLTARRFLGDLWNEVANVDSTTLRTVSTLFRRPGQLTREYVAGRTRWYLPPLRVYLAAFALMIFARTVTHADERIQREVRAQIARTEATNPDLQAIRAKRAARNREVPQLTAPLASAMDVAFSNQWLHLIDPLTVAVVLTLLYRARRRNYAQHVVFALHLLAFNCALSIVTSAMHAAWSTHITDTDAISVVHWLLFAIYAFVALRLVYGGTRPRSAVKAVVLTAGAQVAMMVVPMLTAGVITAWTMGR